MAKSSKKLRLPQPSLNTENNTLPATIANMPSRLLIHSGDKNMRLIFEYYDHNRCEFKSLSSQNMKKVINAFSKITKHNAHNINSICRPTPVARGASGDYGKLFNALPEDFDYLLELEVDRKGRLFIHPYEDMCLVVAVWKEHR